MLHSAVAWTAGQDPGRARWAGWTRLVCGLPRTPPPPCQPCPLAASQVHLPSTGADQLARRRCPSHDSRSVPADFTPSGHTTLDHVVRVSAAPSSRAPRRLVSTSEAPVRSAPRASAPARSDRLSETPRSDAPLSRASCRPTSVSVAPSSLIRRRSACISFTPVSSADPATASLRSAPERSTCSSHARCRRTRWRLPSARLASLTTPLILGAEHPVSKADQRDRRADRDQARCHPPHGRTPKHRSKHHRRPCFPLARRSTASTRRVYLPGAGVGRPGAVADPQRGPQMNEDAESLVTRGTGGETHQTTGDGRPRLTTQQGVVVGDDQNSLHIGERGPTGLEDFHFREKIFHFDHERIPERVVHARGYGAHGFFRTYERLTEITKADLFARAGELTPVFVRFSTVAGNKGSSDLARDVRGFVVKFYTREGNWDLVGNNIPVFFIQDAIKFPDVIHAAKEEPDRGFPQAQTAHDNFWDFASLMPESTHMLMWIMSDRAIPRSFRFMQGFGVHTFRLVNAQGRSTFVKFHWKPKLGLQSVVWNEAVKINGADPDFHRRDLWDAIQHGSFPEWELGLQLFDEDFADRFAFDILDPTKIIPEEEVPVRPVGRLVLDRVVDNFFAETEQVAFCTQNIVPGIDFTNDPLLQGRNFSYLDTQLKRLGSPNFTFLPINAPKCPIAHFQQDGHMTTANPTNRVNYEPNS